MFERFTRDARAAIVMAQEEARGMRHGHIGTEHVMLGILYVDGGGPGERALGELGVDVDRLRAYVAAQGAEREDELDAEALASVGIDLEEVRRATEQAFGPGALDRPQRPWQSGHIPFDQHAKKTLELAIREALHRGDKEISDAHVLLGIVRGEPNPATRALKSFGVEPAALREAVERALGDQAA